MIASVIFGRGGSKGLPGKNTMDILGKAIMEYPLIGCQNSKYINKMYVSTDSDEIADIAMKYNCDYIHRPIELCTDKALLQDAIFHSYKEISMNNDLEYLVITMCNAPNITSEAIDKGIQMLRDDQTIDSVITVGRFDMFAPERARTPDSNNQLKPYVPFSQLTENANCDRSSYKPTYFADGGMTVVRAKCLEEMNTNLMPFLWMGKNIGYIVQSPGGGDVDCLWQVKTAELWIKQNNLA
jgi:CMP-N-acetylneuraminic acid synthetase